METPLAAHVTSSHPIYHLGKHSLYIINDLSSLHSLEYSNGTIPSKIHHQYTPHFLHLSMPSLELQHLSSYFFHSCCPGLNPHPTSLHPFQIKEWFIYLPSNLINCPPIIRCCLFFNGETKCKWGESFGEQFHDIKLPVTLILHPVSTLTLSLAFPNCTR